MYLMESQREPPPGASYVMYSLDLESCTWTRLVPNGVAPTLERYDLREDAFMGSWLHHGKIFYHCSLIQPYLGAPMTNNVVSYDISANAWEWSKTEGEVPSPRSMTSTFDTETSVILFGGFDLDAYFDERSNVFNDLYFMDKETMRWKKIHPNLQRKGVPSAHGTVLKPPQTLTQMSKSKALLLGLYLNASGLEVYGHCWLLELDKAAKHMDPTAIWTRVPINFVPCLHVAVVEPLGRQLWVMGGNKGQDKDPISYNKNPISDILQIKLNPQISSLKEIAMHSIVRGICVKDLRLTQEKLPRNLRQEIDERRSDISAHTSCRKDKKCLACLVAIE